MSTYSVPRHRVREDRKVSRGRDRRPPPVMADGFWHHVTRDLGRTESQLGFGRREQGLFEVGWRV